MSTVVEEGLWIVVAIVCLGVRLTAAILLEVVRPVVFLLEKVGLKI